jgi:hypothetical protein
VSRGLTNKQDDDLWPSPLEVERFRWFPRFPVGEVFVSLPVIYVPIFLIVFFVLVFSGTSFYEGKEGIGIVTLAVAVVAIALILGIWRWWMNQR